MRKHKAFIIKLLKIFLICFAGLLIVENAALYYINSVFLKQKTVIQVDRIVSAAASSKLNINVPIPASAKNLKVSFDGNFIAYTENGNLKLLNMQTGAVKQINMAVGMKLSYYKWIYDRNRLMIAETSQNDYKYYAKLYRIDVKTSADISAPEEIRNKNNTEAIISLRENDAIVDMDFSTKTIETYLKVEGEYGRNVLWEYNVPVYIKRYQSIPYNHIGKIQSIKFVNELMYEDLKNGTVNLADHGLIKIGGRIDLKLLGFDCNDNVYFTQGSLNHTKAVYRGSFPVDVNNNLKNNTSSFKCIDLRKDVSIDSIYVTYSGRLYINDSAKCTLQNVLTRQTYSYKGKLLSVYNTGFLTIDNNKVAQNSIYD